MGRLNRLPPAAMHPTPRGQSRSHRAPLSLTPADLVRSERSQGREPGRERTIWPEISEARARLFADDRATAEASPTLTPVAEHEDSGWQGKRADHQIAPQPKVGHPPAPGDYAPGVTRRYCTRELAPEHPHPSSKWVIPSKSHEAPHAGHRAAFRLNSGVPPALYTEFASFRQGCGPSSAGPLPRRKEVM